MSPECCRSPLPTCCGPPNPLSHCTQGMNVIPLLCTSQFDPSQFANPQTFDPGHFLDENGRFKRNDAFMAFSTGEEEERGGGARPQTTPSLLVRDADGHCLVGKRMCFGEGLAVMELFIFLTSILQHFQLKAEEDRATIDITPESSGLGNIPRPYRLSLIPR